MIENIKRMFRKLTPLEMATHELIEAERAKLEADSAGEYAAALSGYSAQRIQRLRAYITAQTKDQS